MLRFPAWNVAGIALALVVTANAGANSAELGANDEPIKLAMVGYTGQHVSTHLAGQLLEKLGYKVEYVTASVFPVFSGLSDGTISGLVDIWLNNVGDIYPQVLATKKIENIGSLGLETREGWIYPKFMEQICPGLPDWTALAKPECVQALSTPETAPNGRFLDYPTEWGTRSATIIADNDLPYTSVPAGSEGAMVAELDAAEASKTPLLMMFWSPHYALVENEVGWVTMPPCKEQTEQHCITKPESVKIVWSGFGAKWPAAYAFLKEFQVNAREQEKMILAIDKKGRDLDVVVKEWVDSNEPTWRPWIDAGKN
ncbi:glycine/betaine ABC transporter substrate-binding protein [Mesorhizobium loti]|uniref:Glycine/betaine ABC transporter substrate-binding protein n=1 Tax=Rhizobium loti TaxID=381 RepID=A0A101KP37_RHILI|nr:glycine/betaine ABC transporter substrate-binding protein [Mesorhizobium loti]